MRRIQNNPRKILHLSSEVHRSPHPPTLCYLNPNHIHEYAFYLWLKGEQGEIRSVHAVRGKLGLFHINLAERKFSAFSQYFGMLLDIKNVLH